MPIDTLPMAVPVNLRSDDDPAGGNRFAGINLAAPIGIADPERRIIKPYRASIPIINHTLRVTYVIDTNRRILGAFHHELSAAKHLDDVRRALHSAA